jgi:hypothetical protein
MPSFNNETFLKEILQENHFKELCSLLNEWRICEEGLREIENLLINYREKYVPLKDRSLSGTKICEGQFKQIFTVLRTQYELCWNKQDSTVRGHPLKPPSQYSYDIIRLSLNV